jgi:hypothetical protein
LFKFIWNALFGVTVDSIIGDITRKVEKLHAVKERLQQEAVDHEEAALLSWKKASDASHEAGRANVIAEKLARLVS